MKFNLNVNYDIEAENFDIAQEIVRSLTYPGTFAFGTAKLTGVNLNEAYCATPDGLVPLSSVEADEADIPF